MPPALFAARALPCVQPCLRSLARPASRRVLAASASAGASAPAMDAQVRAVVEATHATPTKAVIFLAGGGSQVRPRHSALLMRPLRRSRSLR